MLLPMEAERSLVPTDRRLKRVQIDPSALALVVAGLATIKAGPTLIVSNPAFTHASFSSTAGVAIARAGVSVPWRSGSGNRWAGTPFGHGPDPLSAAAAQTHI
jgi:hypothetical protein